MWRMYTSPLDLPQTLVFSTAAPTSSIHKTKQRRAGTKTSAGFLPELSQLKPPCPPPTHTPCTVLQRNKHQVVGRVARTCRACLRAITSLSGQGHVLPCVGQGTLRGLSGGLCPGAPQGGAPQRYWHRGRCYQPAHPACVQGPQQPCYLSESLSGISSFPGGGEGLKKKRSSLFRILPGPAPESRAESTPLCAARWCPA